MRADVNRDGVVGTVVTVNSPDPVDPADLADLVLRIARRIQALEVRESGGVPLTHLEAMVMSRIDDEPGVTPSHLGAALGLRSSNMSAALKSLEVKGLIVRTPDAADRRVTRIRPTALAAENLAQVRQVWRQALGPVTGGDADRVSAGDLAAAVRVLRQVNDSLD